MRGTRGSAVVLSGKILDAHLAKTLGICFMDKNRMEFKKITIIFLALFFGWCESSLGQDFAKAETGRLASELTRLCKSTDPDRLDYCEGYIDGAMHIWKYATACASQANSDQSFCSGVESARKAIQEAFGACQDCNMGSFRPELGDKPIRGQLFMKRMREFRDKLKVAMGICSPDEHRDEPYCSGYNAEVTNMIAELSVMYPNHVPESTRDLGLGHAASDVGLHLWASEEFYEFRPCLQVVTSSQQVKNLLLEFVHDNPEYQQGATAIVILAKALFYVLCPGPAQELKPPIEQCTTWGFDSGQFGTENTCNKAVVIQFMAKDQRPIERMLNPGEAFRTGLSHSQIGQEWWMFTTCPVGYVSSVPFLPENNDAIRTSRYSCVRK